MLSINAVKADGKTAPAPQKKKGVLQVQHRPYWTSFWWAHYTPLAFDTYRGCSFDCLYCYAKSHHKMIRGGITDKDYTQQNAPEIFLSYYRSDEPRSPEVVWHAIRNRMPLQIGLMTDPFQYMERGAKITYSFLQELIKIPYPVIFSTKGTLFAEDPWLGLLAEYPCRIMRVSICGLSEKFEKIEPNTPTALERIAACAVATKRGIPVIVRIEPYIPVVSDERVDELIARLADAGVRGVICRPLCFPVVKGFPTATKQFMEDRYRRMDEAAGFNIREYYRLHASEDDLHSSVARDIWLKIKDLCKQHQMLFWVESSLPDLSDTPNFSGILDSDKGFENVFYPNFTHALWHAKVHGSVTFDDMERFARQNPVSLMIWNSQFQRSFITKKMLRETGSWTVRDYALNAWNTPRHPCSPSSTLYHLRPWGVDQNGNVIYGYEPSGPLARKDIPSLAERRKFTKLVFELPADAARVVLAEVERIRKFCGYSGPTAQGLALEKMAALSSLTDLEREIGGS